jgi:hypothetical protein
MPLETVGFFSLSAQEFTNAGLDIPFAAWVTYTRHLVIAYGRGFTKAQAIRAALDDAHLHSESYRREAQTQMEAALERIANLHD